MKIKLIIFDLDGVLINSKNNMRLSWNKLTRENNIDTSFDEYFKNIGIPFKKILLKIGIKKNLDKYEKQYFQNSRIFNNKIVLYKRVKKILKYLQSKYKISIITSKKKKNTLFFKNKYFHDINFSLICCPSSKLRSKPFPDLFEHTFKKLKIPPSNSVYVGDTIHDLTAAKKAKTNFIFASYGYSNRILQTKFKIQNIENLKNVLKNI